MDLNQVINAVKRRAESICQILFYIASGLCFIYYVGSFNGSFMPVMGTLISMVLEVALWLLIPVLLSIRRRSIAKWAFLGLSIYWALTKIFDLLQGASLATNGAGALACATGVFSFLIACAMIVMSVFAVVAYWKKDKKTKLIALAIYLCTLVLYLVLFALLTALNAGLAGWSTYFNLLYSYIVIPFAMCFAALAFWFSESDLHFAAFAALPKEPEASPAEKYHDYKEELMGAKELYEAGVFSEEEYKKEKANISAKYGIDLNDGAEEDKGASEAEAADEDAPVESADTAEVEESDKTEEDPQ